MCRAMTVYSINECNKYKAPRGDPRIDPRRIEALERENFILKAQLKKEKNISALAAPSIVAHKKMIAEILFENKDNISDGIYLEIMNALKK